MCITQSIRADCLLYYPPGELDVIVHYIHVLCEGLHLPCSDFKPGVVDTPEPVARSISCEGNQGSALSFLHVEVGHYWGGTAVLLSVETFTVLEVGGRTRQRASKAHMRCAVKLVLLKVLSFSRRIFTINVFLH